MFRGGLLLICLSLPSIAVEFTLQTLYSGSLKPRRDFDGALRFVFPTTLGISAKGFSFEAASDVYSGIHYQGQQLHGAGDSSLKLGYSRSIGPNAFGADYQVKLPTGDAQANISSGEVDHYFGFTYEREVDKWLGLHRLFIETGEAFEKELNPDYFAHYSYGSEGVEIALRGFRPRVHPKDQSLEVRFEWAGAYVGNPFAAAMIFSHTLPISKTYAAVFGLRAGLTPYTPAWIFFGGMQLTTNLNAIGRISRMRTRRKR